MTHKLLDHETQIIIYRSAVRPQKSSTPIHRLAPHGGEVSTSSDPSEDKISYGSPLVPSEGSSPKQETPAGFIRSRDDENPSGSKPMPSFDTADLNGRTFLLPPEENGERHRDKVTRKVVEIIDEENGHRVENINFILDIGNGKVEELISYNQFLEHLETAQDNDLGMDQNVSSSEPSLDTKVIWQHQSQIGRAANSMYMWNGRLGRLLLNPSLLLLLMTQSPVQHIPNNMVYLLWKVGAGSGTLQRKISSCKGNQAN